MTTSHSLALGLELEVGLGLVVPTNICKCAKGFLVAVDVSAAITVAVGDGWHH